MFAGGKWTSKRGHSLISENVTQPKHRHVGCLSRGNCLERSAVHSYFNFGERIWRSGPQRANIRVHVETCPLGATSLDALTQIEI